MPDFVRFVRLVAGVLSLPAAEIEGKREVGDYGFDSVTFHALSNAIAREFEVAVSPPEMFACRRIDDIFGLLLRNMAGSTKALP